MLRFRLRTEVGAYHTYLKNQGSWNHTMLLPSVCSPKRAHLPYLLCDPRLSIDMRDRPRLWSMWSIEYRRRLCSCEDPPVWMHCGASMSIDCSLSFRIVVSEGGG
jgi:hypothetical protein